MEGSIGAACHVFPIVAGVIAPRRKMEGMFLSLKSWQPLAISIMYANLISKKLFISVV